MTDAVAEYAPMTVQEILKDLERYTRRFPKRAMQEAIRQREAVTPDLLRVLEEAASDPQAFAQRSDYMLHLFAMFLLAQFREKRAYLAVVKLFSAPGEIPFDIAGDTVTEGLSQILASVCDGDPEPLQRIIEDDTANEYARSAAIDAFVVLARSAQMNVEDVVTYYRSLFQGKLRRIPCHVWNGLVCAVADLPAPDLLAEVRQAYADELVETDFARLENIEHDLLNPGRRVHGRYGLITDAVAEMEWWACFRPPEATRAKAPRPTPHLTASSSPASPKGRVKTGRNEPCPCGSGKKYKKCCGNN